MGGREAEGVGGGGGRGAQKVLDPQFYHFVPLPSP